MRRKHERAHGLRVHDAVLAVDDDCLEAAGREEPEVAGSRIAAKVPTSARSARSGAREGGGVAMA